MRLALARIAPVAFLAVTVAACGQRMGACEGYSKILDKAFCEDLNADECQRYDKARTYGASWLFHEGQTCTGLGYDVTAMQEMNMSAEEFEADLHGLTPQAATTDSGDVTLGR